MIHTFNVTPVGKPRMTRRDKWAHRPVVDNYYSFKDELCKQAYEQHFILPDSFRIDFYIPMPESWSQKKKKEDDCMPHKQKPDIDNLLKAVMDSFMDDDSSVYSIKATKYWSKTPYITITTLF